MTSGSVLPLDITVNVTSSIDSVALANPQLPYDVSVTVTTSSLITVPFIYVGATSSVSTNVVVSALEPYNLNVYPTSSADNIVVASDVLPYTVAVSATESYNTFVVPSPQGTPEFQVVTTADTHAVTASLAYQAYTASYLLGSIQSASYAATASVLYGTVESSSWSRYAITSAFAESTALISAGTYSRGDSVVLSDYVVNQWALITGKPVGLVSSSTQINSGTFSGSFHGTATSASFVSGAYTSKWALSSSYALTASYANRSTTASYVDGFIESASYAATASVLYGSIESSSFATFAYTSSLATTASMARYAAAVSWSNVVAKPVGLVSSSVQINTGSFSGSITTASYAITASYAQNVPTLAWGNITGTPVGLVSSSVQINTGSFSGSITLAQTASYVATASYAATASYVLSNKDIELPVCSNQPANTVIKAISSQLNEPDSSDRFQFDLSTYSQYRVTAQVIRAGPSGSKVGVQYSTDQTNWHYLDTTSGSLLSVTSTGIRTTNWFNLDVSSHSDVFIRWVACNGDDLSDLAFRYISLGVR